MDPRARIEGYGRLHRESPWLDSLPGAYGRFGCDANRALLESALAKMKAVDPNPDFIVMSGDMAAHDLVSTHDEAVRTVTNLLNATFPNTLVVPCIGNNDLTPDYEGECNSDGLANLYETWSLWIPEQQKETFHQMGAFALTPAFNPGLVFLSINTNIFSIKRHAVNTSDDCGIMNWLSDQLANAKNEKKKVYIVGHVIPGLSDYDFTPLWNPLYLDSYGALMSKYRDTVVAGFFGHIHVDEFRFVSDKQASEPLAAVTLVGPAISPVYDNNPGFHLFTYTPSSLQLLDYANYLLDLSNANLYDDAEWFLDYNFRDAYKVSQIDVESMVSVYRSFASNAALFRLYDARKNGYYDDKRGSYMCVMSCLTADEFDKCMKLNHNYA
eukprot:TRINITY_DN6267_c0_g1_i1.p1 TRINITY_DN6267_c0_g1~~TRINITY_DN6267_c0_g1_i1.p1  ORF type:complete len:438 (+),score=133.18 TRINITY_DN6267_c0_g1_i1:167-1315(+)